MSSRPYPACLLVLLTIIGPLCAEPGLYIQWAFQTDGPVRGEAVVFDNSVYFGSADGRLYAVAADDGSLQWKVDTGGAIAGAPAVTDDVVVVVGRGEQVYALSRADGVVRWSFDLRPDLPTTRSWNYFTAAPVVNGDQVLVPSGDGALYALDLADGSEHWRFQTDDSLRASPLVADGVVYQPSGDDHVYALSTTDGSELWRVATEGVGFDLSQGFIRSDIFTRPTLADGFLINGSRDSNVYAIDVATHEVAWTFSYDSTWAMSTTVHDGLVYVGWSTNKRVSALDLHTGELVWDQTVGAHTYTTASVMDGVVIWGCADGTLYHFDAKTGAPRGTYTVGSEIYGSPIQSGDVTYIGTDDGRLLALAPTSGPAAKAVYLPENIPGNLQGFIIDAQLAPYLTERGYPHLSDTAALVGWLDTHTDPTARSVLVLAYPLIPDEAMGTEPADGPLRAYLEAGGKVVMPWGVPNKVTFNADGSFKAYDLSIAERFLGVKVLGFEDSGNYAATATQTGRNWGLPASTKTTFAYLDPTSYERVTALAIDEYGRPSAWVRNFRADRPTSGWVAFLPSAFGVPFTAEQLALLERVAGYGID
ncbi:PQQ-binding-like beta-propeller repeat protein [Actomonas aquatica]|uniref:PQQ-binding-like beta-propeller repeat protein n=1 Tax=Actomonas aquatica TaxID=2866162 RepID=A0ABZ1C274_9BACT|nr:PQQ-binding-like beta-propeller repeat protein [Opitutus sp. WL0086]WRQ85783.1 PQQ-binding-like beta-propeller repeat protein [Opitutus sp. WL0086]